MENTTSQINDNLQDQPAKQSLTVSGDDSKDQKIGLPLLTSELFESLIHSALDKRRTEAISRDEDTGLIEDLHILFVVLFNDVPSAADAKKGFAWNTDSVEKAFTTFMLYLKFNTGFEYNVSYLKHHMADLTPALQEAKSHFEYLLKDLNKKIQSMEGGSCNAYLLDGFLKLMVSTQKPSPYEIDLDLNEIHTIFRLSKNSYSLQVLDVEEKSGTETLLRSEWR